MNSSYWPLDYPPLSGFQVRGDATCALLCHSSLLHLANGCVLTAGKIQTYRTSAASRLCMSHTARGTSWRCSLSFSSTADLKQ